MANAFQILSKDYRIETAKVVKPIYDGSTVGKVFPIIRDLKPHSKEVRYFTEEDDKQYRYNMETEFALTNVGYTQTDVATPVITVNQHYDYDELQRVNDSTLPLDERWGVSQKIQIEAQERIAYTGATVALDDIAVTTVDTTGTNSTAATTAFNVTTHALCMSTFEAMLGQLIDGLGELTDPLALVVNPDLYKDIRGLVNANTDLRALTELNNRMTEINAASPGVIMSKYLTATVARSAPGLYTITAGSNNACLFNINPNYYRIHASVVQIRADPVSQLSGLHMQLVERFRPVFIKKEAIIYEDAATTA
jgi:hypothetical protein